MMEQNTMTPFYEHAIAPLARTTHPRQPSATRPPMEGAAP